MYFCYPFLFLIYFTMGLFMPSHVDLSIFFSADEIHEYGADDRCPRVLWAFNRQQKQTKKLVCANTIDLRDIHDF